MLFMNEMDESMIMNIIEAVQQNTYIWDFQHPLNKSKIRKQKFWADLAFVLNHNFNPNVKVKYGDASRVWNALRSRFVIHYKRKLNNAERVTTWRYYKPLEFLIPRIKFKQITKKSVRKKGKNKSYKKFIKFSDKSSVADSLTVNSLNNECDDSNRSLATTQKTIDYNIHNIITESREVDSNDASNSKQLIIKNENEASYTLVIPEKTIENDSLSAIPHNPNTNSSLLPDQQLIDYNIHYTEFNKSYAEPPDEVNTNQIVDRRMDNANSALGVYVASEIAQLDPDLQISAKKQINNILMELLKEQLRRRLLSTM